MARGESKQRMLTSAITLLRQRGASGVTIDAVLAHSGAPRGSVYHHFPGGRNELVLTSVRLAGDYISGLLDEAVAGADPRDALRQFGRFWQAALRDSDFQAGCPVVALAVDHRDDLPEAAALVQEIFAEWHRKLRDLLRTSGLPTDRADRLATLTVAAIEGAVLLCRAERRTDPLDDVVTELLALLP